MVKNSKINKNPIEPNKEKEIQDLKNYIEDLEWYIEEFNSFLPIAICGTTGIGKITFINQVFQELVGYKEIDIIGQPIEKIFLEKEKIKKILEEISLKESIKREELTLITKEKKEIPVDVNAALRKDKEGNALGYFFSISDITELKRLQKNLEKLVEEKTKELQEKIKELEEKKTDIEIARKKAEEEKNKTSLIIQNFTDGILVFDKKEKISLINPQITTFFRIKPSELIGKSLDDLSKISDLNPLVEVLKKETKKIFRKEVQIKENLILEITSVSLTKNGENFGKLVILHDITREKTIERIKTEFVSISAHQLRTPLSAIKWTLHMILEGDLGPINIEQKEFLEKIYKSNERMINLINDLLDVSRIEEGRYIYHLTWVDLSQVVDSVINMFEDEIKKKDLRVLFQKPFQKTPKVLVDEEKIKLAIQNLLENSIKYTRKNGEILIFLEPLKKEIKFSIKDNGLGIPKNQQWRVFSKFFRGSNVIQIEPDGTGLGLFITKNIIEAHGGKIWFESEEGKGTTFYFTLPFEKTNQDVSIST